MTAITIAVEEIREGDRFVDYGRHHWTALADSDYTKVLDSDDEGLVTVPVRFADGGSGVRAWDTGMTILIERDEEVSVEWVATIRAYDRHSVTRVWAVSEEEAIQKAGEHIHLGITVKRA